MKRTWLNIFIVLLTGVIFCGTQLVAQEEVKKEEQVSIPKVDLHSAVVTDNFDVIYQHIKSGSDLNVLEPSRASTPLITAAAFGKSEAAKILIENGVDVNYQNADGSTALHTACVFNHLDIVKMLIDAKADLNIANNQGSTALHSAAFLCRPEIVDLLLENGADKTLKNRMGQTAYETVSTPFETVKGVYDFIGSALRPMGLVLDYDYIQKTRPLIAEKLK